VDGDGLGAKVVVGKSEDARDCDGGDGHDEIATSSSGHGFSLQYLTTRGNQPIKYWCFGLIIKLLLGKINYLWERKMVE